MVRRSRLPFGLISPPRDAGRMPAWRPGPGALVRIHPGSVCCVTCGLCPGLAGGLSGPADGYPGAEVYPAAVGPSRGCLLLARAGAPGALVPLPAEYVPGGWVRDPSVIVTGIAERAV